MSTFRMPSTLCKEIDSMVRQFWWGTKRGSEHFLALRVWKDLCQPKLAGGLSFKFSKYINSALLAKLSWKIARDDDSLWCRILQAKYVKGNSSFEINKAKGCSPGWQGILSSKNFLLKGVCFKIGNGLKVNPWKDSSILEIDGKIPRLKEVWMLADGAKWCIYDWKTIQDGIQC